MVLVVAVAWKRVSLPTVRWVHVPKHSGRVNTRLAARGLGFAILNILSSNSTRWQMLVIWMRLLLHYASAGPEMINKSYKKDRP